jgi:3-oxoadipate enol-lactonase/4-carboxymuconolactone decarboxylase
MSESELFRKGKELMERMFGDAVGDLDLSLPEGDPAQREWTAWTYGHLMQERGVLDLKTRALLAVAMLTALGEEDMLSKWIRGSLKLGCRPEEIREMIITTSVYAGYPKTRRALKLAENALNLKD